MRIDVERFIEGIHDYLGKAFDPVIKRLATLEARQPEKGERGENGVDGKDAPAIDTAHVIAEVLKQIPAPKDGKDGDPTAFFDELIELFRADTHEA